jgi:hypothetical protein
LDIHYPKRDESMSVQLSMQDVKELKDQGYSEFEIQTALKEVEREDLEGSYKNVQQQRGFDPRQNSQISSFATKQDENIIRWQLELNDILERAEHILRGDIPTFDQGHIFWKTNPHPELNTLNETGVQEIMKVLAMYINRNKILADYDNGEIKLKVFDFGRALNNLIFMRDFEFGMDTEEKRKNYEMIVNELKDMVHDSYKRALDGAEKRSLREMITVSQQTSTSANLGNGVVMNQQGMPEKQRGLLNPLRYLKSKAY